jgi:hypothetical protein
VLSQIVRDHLETFRAQAYARTAYRRQEIAIRTALGASRLRIVAQLSGEALALAVVPAIAGLALAQYVLRLGRQIQDARERHICPQSVARVQLCASPARCGRSGRRKVEGTGRRGRIEAWRHRRISTSA